MRKRTDKRTTAKGLEKCCSRLYVGGRAGRRDTLTGFGGKILIGANAVGIRPGCLSLKDLTLKK